MEKEVLSFVTEKTNELINANSCSNEAKQAAEAWLKSIGTENEREETERYIAELESDVLSVDDVIAFLGTDDAVKMFGTEKAKKFLDHIKEIKANGAKYCDCPACAAGAAILEKKNLIIQ